MTTIANLMDRAKAASCLPSDYALAKEIGVHTPQIYSWRSERRFPTADQILAMAELAGDPAGYWLCVLYARKAQNANLARRYSAEASKIAI